MSDTLDALDFSSTVTDTGDAAMTAPDANFAVDRPANEPTWMRECRNKGGDPYYDQATGAAMCMIDGAPVVPTVFHGFSVAADFSRFTDQNITHPLSQNTTVAQNASSAATAVVAGVKAGNAALPLPDAGDILSKLTGLPKGVALGIALLSVYALAVQAGILPPLRRLVK